MKQNRIFEKWNNEKMTNKSRLGALKTNRQFWSAIMLEPQRLDCLNSKLYGNTELQFNFWLIVDSLHLF